MPYFPKLSGKWARGRDFSATLLLKPNWMRRYLQLLYISMGSRIQPWWTWVAHSCLLADHFVMSGRGRNWTCSLLAMRPLGPVGQTCSIWCEQQVPYQCWGAGCRQEVTEVQPVAWSWHHEEAGWCVCAWPAVALWVFLNLTNLCAQPSPSASLTFMQNMTSIGRSGLYQWSGLVTKHHPCWVSHTEAAQRGIHSWTVNLDR